MTPEHIVGNITTLVQALLPGGGTLSAVVGTLAYGYGKAADSPAAVAWGKKGWIGAGVLFGGTAVIGLVQNVSSRIFA